ncbi:hypothetical protein CPC16_006096 [Podila verticillata]|nr:hypothetical protein CPC16_006096 [Podila verticillata]
MPNLQELHLSGGVGQYVIKVMLKHLPESIHKVHLFFSRHLPHTVNPTLLQRLDTVSRRQPFHHHALEFLRLDGKIEDDAEGILLPFLYTCTRRLTLRVSPFEIKCFRRQAMRAAWLQVGFTLKSLHHIPTSLDGCIFSGTEDRDIAWTIRWDQDWRTLTLNWRQTASLTASATLDHCDHLQEIVLVGCDRITSIGLQSILSTARNLRVFRVMSEVRSQMSDPFLDAVDVASSPEWACRRLQKFICEIQVPRSDDQVHPSVVEGFFWDSPSVEYCLDIQRQVFRQLTLLKKLRTLRLGKVWCMSQGSMSPYQPCSSLEMTLESGLKKLASINDMKELSVRLVNHRISVKELS